MEAKYVRFKILINNSETQLIKNIFMWQFVLIVLYTCFIEYLLFFLKLFWIFSVKIDCITLDPDPNCTKILDPDPNSMYLDPHNRFWFKESMKSTNLEVQNMSPPLLIDRCSILLCGCGSGSALRRNLPNECWKLDLFNFHFLSLITTGNIVKSHWKQTKISYINQEMVNFV